MNTEELKAHFLSKMQEHKDRGGKFTADFYGVCADRKLEDCAVCAVGACLLGHPDPNSIVTHVEELAQQLMTNYSEVFAIEAGYCELPVYRIENAPLYAFGQQLRALFPPTPVMVTPSLYPGLLALTCKTHHYH